MNSADLATVFVYAVQVRMAMTCDGASLDHAVESVHSRITDPVLKSAIQAVSYETVRNLAAADKLIERFAKREPDRPVCALLEAALARMIVHPEKDFVTVDQAVKAARLMPETKASAGFINAILRRYGRERSQLAPWLAEQEGVRFNAPDWWLAAYRRALGEKTDAVLQLQRTKAPLTLRVNRRQSTPEDYIRMAASHGIQAVRTGLDAVTLEKALPVSDIPGFSDGMVSVQDAGSQLAAPMLAPADGERILDACAAPGGKTTHLLEIAEADITALDVSPGRCRAILENLDRLGFSARVQTADASKPQSWWDRRKFDAILLDAPCTASGIVRRHPDIPWQHSKKDIHRMARTQRYLLEALWPLLEKHGRLLYCVCSIFPEEGTEQIEAFLRRHPEACCEQGPRLLLPHEDYERSWQEEPLVHDGYFLTLLRHRK